MVDLTHPGMGTNGRQEQLRSVGVSQHFSDREAVAAALVSLVRARLRATRSHKTLRTALHARVPVSERPSVRRGLDALIDHGVLAMSGEDIGFTAKGRLLLAHVQQSRGQAPSAYEHDDDSPKALAALLRAIEQDERFDPYTSLEEVETLPARLEAERRARARSGTTNMPKWIFLLLLIVAAAAVFYYRHQ